MLKPGNPLAIRALTALAALASALACSSLGRGGLEPGAAAAGEARLEAANKRWQGNRCRLALPLEIRKGEGAWTSSAGVFVAKGEAGRGEFYFRVLVDDRSALDAVFDGHVLRQDTPLLAEGWRLKDPESNKGVFLELRFADQPAKARVEFRGVRQFDFEGFPLDRLEEVEDYCRSTLFALSGAAEALPAAAPQAAPRTAVPAAPAPPVAAPAPSPVSAAPSPARAAERPALQLVRVAVSPERVPRGGDVELVAVYSVAGLTPGGAVDVLERREVSRDGVAILSTEDRYERPAATFTSAKPVRFSFDAAPGAYLLRVTIEAAGARAEGTASFEIR